VELPELYAGLAAASTDPWALNDYGSPRSQRRRFKVVTEELGLRTRDSLADVGCGTGEYAAWLQEHGIDVQYAGYDALPEMVEATRAKGHTASVLDAFRLDIPKTFDYAVAIGVMSPTAGTTQERMAKLTSLVAMLHDRTKRGWAITVQTNRPGKKSDTTGLRWYMDPQVALAVIAEVTDCAPMRVRMDYHPFDICISVSHDPY
jgi:SAM-dependent methyltransferase